MVMGTLFSSGDLDRVSEAGVSLQQTVDLEH